MPVGGLVQPLAAGGLPENPETKRRFKNLIDVTGMAGHLDLRTAEAATEEDLRRVHPESYLSAFKAASRAMSEVSSPSATMCRWVIPVRWRIHSSSVSTKALKSPFVRIFFGK